MDNLTRKNADVYIHPVARTYITDINILYGRRLFFQRTIGKIAGLRKQLKAKSLEFADKADPKTPVVASKNSTLSITNAERELSFIDLAEQERDLYENVTKVLGESVEFLTSPPGGASASPESAGDAGAAGGAAAGERPCNEFRQRLAQELK